MNLFYKILLCAFIVVFQVQVRASTNSIDIKIINDSVKNKVAYDKRLSHFYKDSKGQAIWLSKDFDASIFQTLITTLDNGEQHGLSSKLFQTPVIKNITDSLNNNLYSKQQWYDALARLEVASTKAAISYIKAMRFGQINPREILPDDYFIETIQPDTLYYTYINKMIIASPLRAMQQAIPKGSEYVNLQEKLSFYLSITDTDFKKITLKNNKNYQLHDVDDNIALIVDRLVLTNDFNYYGSDSLKNVFTQDLMDAINKFKRKNFYAEDSEIGLATITALNQPISLYITKLKASLERYRWRHKKKTTARRVLVNVAPAYLIAYDENKAVLQMKTCVGSTKNRTPLMQSDINIINYNPVWYVPKSIVQEELYHSIKKNPDYLKKRNMIIKKGGKEIDPSTIDWEKTSSSGFNYSISQESGSGNSLGLVKFLFSNRFAVYLHDTPSKSIFNRRVRAVSHGCVRLEKPFDFAMYCSSELNNVLYKDQILHTVELTPESDEGKKALKENKLKKLPDVISIKKHIPITIDYYTAFIMPDENDTIHFAEDIYNYDTIILSAMGQ